MPNSNRPSFLTITREERDKFTDGATRALLAGIGKGPIDPTNWYSSYSLPELAREACRVANQSPAGNIMEIVGRALTTTDFPNILANVANAVLLEAYDTAPETYLQWCKVDVLRDFKDATIARASEVSGLDEVPEGTPYPYGNQRDAAETVALATYGKIFAYTRQSLVNDNLSALTDTARAHGEAAARKIGDLAYSVLTANAAMADGIALFHATHGNLASATATVGTASLGAGIAAMKKQKDILGERVLNIRPKFFIGPAALEGAAEVFFRSDRFDDAEPGATRVNPYSGNYFSRVYDPRLDDSSATAWYLAGPMGKTVNVYLLVGQDKPHIEQKEGWAVDGLEFKVRLDAAAKAVDWRALYKVPGA